jgi:selenocysteine lyase/cysteine desulfurase
MALRDAFPVLRTTAYLNAGTNGPVPEAADAAMRALLDTALREGRSSPAWFEAAGTARVAQREAYAEALGARPQDVALTTGTSEGVVRVLAGLDWYPGDEVVTADDEHPGLLGPLAALRARRGVEVREVPLADIPDAVGPQTRLVACSHVSWITGALAPAALAELPPPVLLDGAQGAGALTFDVAALGCDFYAAAGQKWLCGPGATGLLWVRPGAELEPLGPTYVNVSDPAAGLGAEPWPDARAHDLPPFDPVLAAGAAAAWAVLRAHPERTAAAVGLAARFAEALRERGRTVAERGDTTLVAWEEADPEAAVARLAEAGVVVRALPGGRLVRASIGGWSSEDDLERLLTALP